MINSPQSDAALIDALARSILDDESDPDLDMLDRFNAAADILTANAFLRLAAAIDFCPFHRCDLDACADDDRDCLARLDEMLP